MKTRPVPKATLGLRFLYKTIPGRGILKVLSARGLSEICGRYLDSPASKWLIEPFLKANDICLEDYLEEDYTCFNDCFCRQIKPELRPIDQDKSHLIAPCDGLLSVYPIEEGLVIPVKQSIYDLDALLRDKKLAKKYEQGVCFVFRLCVDHYHRYSYPVTGKKTRNRFIPGKLHTVRPIALNESPVFTENCRAYTQLRSKTFGDIVQMEVGAMLVGKIHNNHEKAYVIRGQEKGRFLYGGSTIILLVEGGKVDVPAEFFRATMMEEEIEIKMGQCIATAKKKVN